MMGFIDAKQLLSNLQKGEALTEKLYYISFDNQKNSLNDLSELKSRCSRLGYSFNSVEMHWSHKSDSPILFYLVRNLPLYPTKQFKEYELFDEAIG